MTPSRTPSPPPPPPRQFWTGLFGTHETTKSIRDRRDWEMFMKGYRFALGEPNTPGLGDYL